MFGRDEEEKRGRKRATVRVMERGKIKGRRMEKQRLVRDKLF